MGWDKNIPSGDGYDWVSFTLTNGQSDYDLKANQASLWKNLAQASGIVIISDQAIGIKINNTLLPKISITTTQMPWEFINKKIVRNAYLSNASGSDASVQVLLV